MTGMIVAFCYGLLAVISMIFGGVMLERLTRRPPLEPDWDVGSDEPRPIDHHLVDPARNRMGI